MHSLRSSFVVVILVVINIVMTAACAMPLPREVLMTFDVGKDSVKVDAVLTDLVVERDDELLAFDATASIIKPDFAAMDKEHKLWFQAPSSYVFTDQGQRVDLAFNALIPRADWDACLKRSCDEKKSEDSAEASKIKEMCALFPLQKCASGFEVRGDESYEVPAGLTSTWPKDATHIVYRARLGAKAGQHSIVGTYRIVAADVPAAQKAQTWMSDLAAAYEAEDAVKVNALAAQTKAFPGALRGVAEDQLLRWRMHLLYTALDDAGDNIALARPNDPLARGMLHNFSFPKKKPSREVVWAMRALHEVTQHAPETFDVRRDDLCAHLPFGTDASMKTLCAYLGYDAKIKAKR